jgi:hypothetical protein
VRDEETGKLSDASYAYLRQPQGGGSMDFTFGARPINMMEARWAVRSRWQAGGAGRSDVKAKTAEGVDVTANECWNTSFASTFLAASWAPAAGYGNQATDCVFTSAEYSPL